MKKFFLKVGCTTILVLILSLNIISQTDSNSKKFVKYSTAAEMNILAKKYNMPYVITDSTNNGVLFMFKSQAEAFFKEQSEALNRRKEYKEFLEKTKNVRNYDDYFNLVYSIPTTKAYMIEIFKTEEALKTHWNKVRTQEWRIYRHKSGELRFIPSEEKETANDLKYFGQRIDDLPKQ